jgi:hypothetical protein
MVYVNQTAHTLIAVLQTVGAFNLLFLLACAWFTWGGKKSAVASAADQNR